MARARAAQLEKDGLDTVQASAKCASRITGAPGAWRSRRGEY
jgi:hypothetical protein